MNEARHHWIVVWYGWYHVTACHVCAATEDEAKEKVLKHLGHPDMEADDIVAHDLEAMPDDVTEIIDSGE